MRRWRSAGFPTCVTGAGGRHTTSFAPRRRPRYPFAFLAVAIATGGVGLLMVLISQPAFVLYIAAVAASTWYGGGRTGLVAVALALLASPYLFIPPYFSLTNEQSILPLLMFYCSTVVLTTLVSLHMARPRGKSTQSTRPLRSHDTGRKGHHNDVLDPGAD
jgi:K+-sensing histidine kinase KdpD